MKDKNSKFEIKNNGGANPVLMSLLIDDNCKIDIVIGDTCLNMSESIIFSN